MPETLRLLEQATENEAKKFLELVASLENAELYQFIRAVSELKLIPGASTINEIIHIAGNVKGIDEAVDNFYVV